MARRTTPLARAGGMLVALGLLAACGSNAGDAPPTWKPAPSFQGPNVVPGNPQPNIPAPSDPSDPGNSSSPGNPSDPGGGGSSTPGPSGSQSPTKHQDPNVVAEHLDNPIGVAILPDNTALVGERTTGRIVRVQPEPGKPVKTVRTIPGLSTKGGGGLLDLALSPNYSQDNLIFAYVTTPTDNRVVTFTLDGPITPVLTGIPRGTKDNAGRIAFASDGSLLIGTGDAGHPQLAADPSSLAGKILRVTDIGTPARGNPRPGSRIYTSGHHVVDGLCVDPSSGAVYETETRSVDDPVNKIVAGASYGWPSAGAGYRNPLVDLPATARGPGGCAVLGGEVYVTSRDGKRLLHASLLTALTPRSFKAQLTTYGRLRTVVAAADGALWVTTSNRDGAGTPTSVDDRVLRILPSGGNAGNQT